MRISTLCTKFIAIVICSLTLISCGGGGDSGANSSIPTNDTKTTATGGGTSTGTTTSSNGATAVGDPLSQSSHYLYYLPENYDKDETVRWPLIISLHGAGGLIPDDNLIEVAAKRTPGFRFIVVAPIARSYGWSNVDLELIYAEVTKRFRVNADNIYLTGLSMGAYGAWSFAVENPHRFAAMALISGGINAGNPCTLKHLPIWLFYNRADSVVAGAESENAAATINACGGKAKLTAYDTVPAGVWDHNAWRAAWTSPELYDWFLQNKRIP